MSGNAIPPEFWRTIKPAEFMQIVENDGLNAIQCARLWRIAGYEGKPPNSMQLVFRREDVMRLWPPRK